MGALVVLGGVSVLAVLAARWSKRRESARSRLVCVAAHGQAPAVEYLERSSTGSECSCALSRPASWADHGQQLPCPLAALESPDLGEPSCYWVQRANLATTTSGEKAHQHLSLSMQPPSDGSFCRSAPLQLST